MPKKVLKPADFARVTVVGDYELTFAPEQLQEINALYDETASGVKAGKLITGTVVEVSSHGVLVDIQYKSDGLIPAYEFSDHELKSFKAGGLIDVILSEIEGPEGEVSISYEKAKALKAWDKIIKLFEEGQPVEGVVTHTVKGGLSVDIGVPAFLPGSQVDIQRVTEFEQFVGKPIIADIIKVNKKRGNVIISRRKYLSEKRAQARRKAMDTLTEGQIVQGIVKNITNYGVFVDIGGVDGLLHITDMTWGRIAHPSEIVKISDTISVKLLSIDKENGKISLGLKQLSENPWTILDPTVQIGSRIKGRISSITDYGLFVEVRPGVEGLVHISEISWIDRVNDLHSLFKVGGEIEVLVVSLDKENRRMSLSVKQLEDDPWTTVDKKFAVGQQVRGPITNITDFGIFIQLMPGVDGLAHVSDLSWTQHIDHPSSLYKRGDMVDALILNIDKENKKVSLGIKHLTQDPWETFAQQHRVGSVVEGEVSKFTNIGVFMRLSGGVEGLVHASELATHEGKRETRDGKLLDIGTKLQLRVTHINQQERKIDLTTYLDEASAEADGVQTTTRGGNRFGAGKRQQQQAKREKEPMPMSQSKPKSQLQLALEQLADDSDDE